ncbi:MAG: PASTA domain-containing protein [Oscillospiraceae bacterium]|nr:PASTA domain-containing protein [Oscillospiraceae bacterium]
MGDMKLCYGCFEPIGDEQICKHCGYKQKSPYSTTYIAPGTMLNDRYLVGKMLSHNGEGATYLAFDTVISCKILIREYVPDSLCTRVKGSPVINVNHDSVAQYKSLMAEFTELNKQLAKLRSVNHINPVLDLFSENNTTYAVFEYIDGVNFIQYLKDNAGELTWKQVSRMFPPLFTSLSILHNAGIVHRGISPQTIYVTNKGELKLTDFCIAAVRTTKTELAAEIFKGYAAPEQYSPSSWQGTWTDVYGLCAVLYRILTGSMPTDASMRTSDGELTSPVELNPDIPENVSNAIMDGMKMSGEERIQTVTELVTRIFEPSEEEKSKTAIHPAIKIPKPEYEEYEYNQPDDEDIDDTDNNYADNIKTVAITKGAGTLERYKFPIMVAFLIIAIVIFIIIFIKGIFSGISDKNGLNLNIPDLTTAAVTTTEEITETETQTQLSETTSQTTTTADDSKGTSTTTDETTSLLSSGNIQMTDITGKKYSDVQLSILAQDISFQPEYEYSDKYERGVIFWQEKRAGEWVQSGSVVKIKVSNGDGSIQVPDYKRSQYSCYPIDDYLAILADLGIKYDAKPEVNTGYYSGYVIGVDPPVGTVIDTNSGDVLIVRYTDNSGNGQEISSSGSSNAETAIPAN